MGSRSVYHSFFSRVCLCLCFIVYLHLNIQPCQALPKPRDHAKIPYADNLKVAEILHDGTRVAVRVPRSHRRSPSHPRFFGHRKKATDRTRFGYVSIERGYGNGHRARFHPRHHARRFSGGFTTKTSDDGGRRGNRRRTRFRNFNIQEVAGKGRKFPIYSHRHGRGFDSGDIKKKHRRHGDEMRRGRRSRFGNLIIEEVFENGKRAAVHRQRRASHRSKARAMINKNKHGRRESTKPRRTRFRDLDIVELRGDGHGVPVDPQRHHDGLNRKRERRTRFGKRIVEEVFSDGDRDAVHAHSRAQHGRFRGKGDRRRHFGDVSIEEGHDNERGARFHARRHHPRS